MCVCAWCNYIKINVGIRDGCTREGWIWFFIYSLGYQSSINFLMLKSAKPHDFPLLNLARDVMIDGYESVGWRLVFECEFLSFLGMVRGILGKWSEMVKWWWGGRMLSFFGGGGWL